MNMRPEIKTTLVCPACGSNSSVHARINRDDGNISYYYCTTPNCNWYSTDKNTIDISYSDNKSAVLSNLFPHKFTMLDNLDVHDARPVKHIQCLSMESFLQSLREPDKNLQEFICSNYSGFVAYKMRLSLRDWRKEGTLYWIGREIKRTSEDYTNLISEAYDRLFDGNILFRTMLYRARKKYLVHTTGCDDITETLLTESEYRYQLNRLIKEKLIQYYTPDELA